MHLLSYFSYIQGATSLGGAAMLGMVIWFFGPSIGMEGFYPLEPQRNRLIAIGVLILFVIGQQVWNWRNRRKAARALEDGIVAERADDTDVLTERLRDALQTLKKAQGAKGEEYLYSIPWYLIIGPPGAGKTTALINSGLKFPLVGSGGTAMVEGVGGTRYCDWWFAEDAVLIDTAGRYTTQDSETEAEGEDNLDRRSWLSFLDLLRTHRRKQPINGVIIAISVDDLVHLSERERNSHADAVRRRLVELYERLRVAFPVYVMFTKVDLIEGFQEFFGDLREKDRRMVWGATFQTEDRTRNTVSDVPPEFDALLLRLSDNLIDRLQSEPNQARRSLIVGFPAQFNALAEPVKAFMSRVFEPTRYHANAILRGFYFNSGTQEGTAFDQLIGAQSRVLGATMKVPTVGSGQGRSYFIHDLLKKVIFGEAGWVSYNRAAIRRAKLARMGVFAAIALVTTGVLAILTLSFMANREVIAGMDRAVEEYRVNASSLAGEVEVSSPDLADPHALLLYPLRTLPIGYESREDGTPLQQTFGLSQRGRLLSASEEAYHRALERSFRSRLILRVEELLQANLDDPQYVYEALKIYKMLGGTRTNDDIIVAWIARDWEENVYPGRLNSEGREALRAHLAAMLALDAGQTPLVGLNEPLVRDAERVLARVPLADLAYARMELEAKADDSLFDWILIDEAGADAAAVFETIDDTDIEAVKVDAFYTYDGFQTALIGRLATIEEDIAAETWLFGEAANQRAIEAQYETLEEDILRRYQRSYIQSWKAMLANIKLRNTVADAPRYTVLRALSSPTSPLRQLLQSVGDELIVTRAPEQQVADASGDGPAVLTAAQVRINEALQNRQALSQQLRTEPGAAIESAFAPLIAFLDTESGDVGIDGVVDDLNEIHDRLFNMANVTGRSPAATEPLTRNVADLRGKAIRMPEPASRLVLQAVKDIEADLQNAAIARLAQSFNQEVTAVCEGIVKARYPFYRSERDVPLADFERLFAPDGTLATYRKERLDQYIDRSGDTWTWNARAQRNLDFSDETLRQFRRAAMITDAFFADESEDGPSFDLIVTTVSLDPSANSGTLRVNRQAVTTYSSSVRRSTPIKWPGDAAVNEAFVSVVYGPNASTGRIERRGPWALFRLIEKGRAVSQDDKLSVTFSVNGKRVAFELSTNASRNPLTLRALREFRCPTGL